MPTIASRVQVTRCAAHQPLTRDVGARKGEDMSVSITIDGHTFEGPYAGTDRLEDRSGVYAILCYREQKHFVVDVGESATLKTRVENHDRSDC